MVELQYKFLERFSNKPFLCVTYVCGIVVSRKLATLGQNPDGTKI